MLVKKTQKHLVIPYCYRSVENCATESRVAYRLLPATPCFAYANKSCVLITFEV